MLTDPILGLRTVLYKVTDIKKATEFYSALLGIQPYFAEAYYVGFNVGGFELGLEPVESMLPKGGVVAYWGVSNADDSLKALVDKGAVEHEAVQDVGGGIKVASVLDPFGNVIGIIENPHFSIAEVR